MFDSLGLVPLRGARITLTSADTVRAVSDTNGVFVVSLKSGAWRAQVSHARFDSLRVVLPTQELDVPAKDLMSTELWTPSKRAVTRMLCGDTAKIDEVALTGIVRDAETHRAIDSASVIAKWINLKLQRGGFSRSFETHVTRTGRDGWYVTCGVPANGTLISWAEHQSATSGAVPLAMESISLRLDFSIDRNARLAGGSIDLEPDSSGVSLFPIASGTARYRVLVRDPGGRPLPNARVRIMGQRTVRTNDAGTVMLDSIAGGTQTLEVMAIGYQPQRRVVDVAPGRIPTDTLTLASLGTMLDTIRVTASRGSRDFARRRSEGGGQFITAADVEREDPARTSQLIRAREGLRLAYDRHGFPYIEVTTQTLKCKPIILLDGFPAAPVPTVPGETMMDWFIHPDEIGGVEIYTNPARIPPELGGWGNACGMVAFWTRQALGLPAGSFKH